MDRYRTWASAWPSLIAGTGDSINSKSPGAINPFGRRRRMSCRFVVVTRNLPKRARAYRNRGRITNRPPPWLVDLTSRGSSGKSLKTKTRKRRIAVDTRLNKLGASLSVQSCPGNRVQRIAWKDFAVQRSLPGWKRLDRLPRRQELRTSVRRRRTWFVRQTAGPTIIQTVR